MTKKYSKKLISGLNTKICTKEICNHPVRNFFVTASLLLCQTLRRRKHITLNVSQKNCTAVTMLGILYA